MNKYKAYNWYNYSYWITRSSWRTQLEDQLLQCKTKVQVHQ